MALSTESRNILNEFQKAGVDATVLAGLERELDTKPTADETAKNMLLSQNGFNDYRNKKDQEIADLKKKVEQTASLSTAANNLSGDLKEAALKQIQENKDWFESQGYDVGEIEKLAEDMANKGIAFTTNKANEVITKKEDTMPDPNPTGKNFIDDKTLVDVLRTTGSNLAAGGINISTHIARALHEADKLGVDLTDEKLDGFAPALIKGLEEGKQPRDIIDNHFGFSAKRTEKSEQLRKAELDAAEAKGRQEALKEAGVTIRNQTNRPKHLIFDRESPSRKAIETQKSKDEAANANIKSLDDLPKNSKGDPEYFRLRGSDEERKSRHLENASKRFSEVAKEYDDDGLYVGHRQQA